MCSDGSDKNQVILVKVPYRALMFNAEDVKKMKRRNSNQIKGVIEAQKNIFGNDGGNLNDNVKI